MIWVVFALMTGAAVLAALWPLARLDAGADRAGVERALYQAELCGIDRDLDRGLATPDDARAAKTEAARRLIAAREDPPPRASTARRRAAAAIALVFIPGLAFGLYRAIGAADYPDQPLEARLKAPPGAADINVAVAQIEKHLADHPDDARGWEILAPVYMRLGRARDSAEAWRRTMQLQGVTAERAGAYGEALVHAEDGRVTPAARGAFEIAVQNDPQDARARFFLGLAAEQAGDKPQAIDLWTKLLADASPDAPFAPTVRAHLAALGAGAGAPASGPASAQGAAIAAMPAEQREATIRGMVDGLASRLAQGGGGLDEWLRLVRAYAVLKQPDKARAALADARKALGADPAASGRLDAASQELGLGG